MSALICGSLAFDTITRFHGRFADQILPDQLHILNVSFLVPTMRKEFGGCSGNIAYSLKLLGDKPLIAATLGDDSAEYLTRIESWGLSREWVHVVPGTFTAQALITTDQDNNQINAFHPGAMQYAHQIQLQNLEGINIAIVAPDGRDAMIQHARQLNEQHVPFIFDPGQGLPMFNGDELKAFVSQATWVAVNDYEAKMLCDRIDTTIEELSKQPHLKAVFVTLGAKGCEIWINGECHVEAGLPVENAVDPTGCGDSFRSGLLYGLERGWTAAKSVRLANRIGAIKVACSGPQNHQITADIFENLD